MNLNTQSEKRMWRRLLKRELLSGGFRGYVAVFALCFVVSMTLIAVSPERFVVRAMEAASAGNASDWEGAPLGVGIMSGIFLGVAYSCCVDEAKKRLRAIQRVTLAVEGRTGRDEAALESLIEEIADSGCDAIDLEGRILEAVRSDQQTAQNIDLAESNPIVEPIEPDLDIDT